MLLQILLFFFLLGVIFLTTKRSVKYIYQVIFLISRNKHLTVWVLAILLLPGTIIHELSHFILATLLRVPVGNISILPQVREKSEVTAGHVTLGKSDPFRMSLIGLAPMIIGLILIFVSGRYFLGDLYLNVVIDKIFIYILGFILFFEISTTMFSSKRDLYSFLIILPVIILLLLTSYVTGVKVLLEEKTVIFINKILTELNFYLLLTAVTDYFIFLVFHSIIFFGEKIFRIKIRIN